MPVVNVVEEVVAVAAVVVVVMVPTEVVLSTGTPRLARRAFSRFFHHIHPLLTSITATLTRRSTNPGAVAAAVHDARAWAAGRLGVGS